MFRHEQICYIDLRDKICMSQSIKAVPQKNKELIQTKKHRSQVYSRSFDPIFKATKLFGISVKVK